MTTSSHAQSLNMYTWKDYGSCVVFWAQTSKISQLWHQIINSAIVSFIIAGSRPESSEGEPPAFSHASDRHHATLALVGTHPGAPLPSLPALLDPRAINMMPPEFDQDSGPASSQSGAGQSNAGAGPQIGPKIQELQAQFQHLGQSQAPPKGSLVWKYA